MQAPNSARIGAGGMPESALGQAPAVTPFSMEAAGQVNPIMQEQSLAVTPQAPETLPSPGSVNAALNQEVAVGLPSVEGQPEKPGFFKPGGFGYEYLGPRLGDNIGQFAGEQLYGTGVTADGQATGFPVDRPSLLGDVATLPGNLLRAGDFFAGPVVDTAIDKVPGVVDYVTGASGVEAQQAAQAAEVAEEAQGQVATLDPTSDAAILANRARREAQFSEQGAPAVNQQQPAAPGAIPPLQTFVGPSGTGYQEAPEGMVKAMGPDGKMVFTTPEQADQMNQSYLSELNASKQAQKDFLSSDVGQNEMTLQGMRNAAARRSAEDQQANGGQAAQRPNLPGFNAGQNTQGSINNPSFDAGQGGQGRLKVQTVPQSSDFFQRGPTPSSDFLSDFSLTDLRSLTPSDDSKAMSYSDAKIRARGELARRGIEKPSSSMLRALAKSIQLDEPERLAGLKTERALNEARLQTAQAEQNKPEFRGRVYTVDGVTFAQTSRGGVQVISTGTEDPEKATRETQKFEFTKKKIEDAREAYLAGDVTKANDILASAEIKQYGYQADAAQYFADSTPPGTPPASITPVTPSDPASPVTDSGLTQQQEDRIQAVMRTNPTKSRAEVIEAMQKKGKL
jgi:hypothetical protein